MSLSCEMIGYENSTSSKIIAKSIIFPVPKEFQQHRLKNY